MHATIDPAILYFGTPVALVSSLNPIEEGNPDRRGKLVALEVRIVRVHVAPEIRMAGSDHRIDPERWRPLIMSFGEFFGLGGKLRPSTLATIPEEAYRIAAPPAQAQAAA